MSDPNFSAIRARLRYENVEEFVDNYGRYISHRGMFLPMAASKLKPVGTTVRFQLLLADGTSAMLGEGVVRKLKGLEEASDDGPVGMLVKFSKLSSDSKQLVEQVMEQKARAKAEESATQPAAEAMAAESEPTTGVMAAEKADELVSESNLEAAGKAPRSSQIDQKTQEMELSADDEATSQEVATSGDEIFGDGGADAVFDESAAQDDPFADFDAGESEGDDQSFGEPAAQDDPFADFDAGEPESEGQALGEPEPSDAFAASEPSDAYAESEDQSVADGPFEQEMAQGEAEGEGQAVEPKALAESEGGLKVMAYDESELDDDAAREFEEFALAGEEDDVDEMFDNIFGGGDGEDLFGGGGGEDDEFFGAGDGGEGDFFGGGDDEADEDVEAAETAEEESAADLAVDSEFVGEEEEAVETSSPSVPEAEAAAAKPPPAEQPEAVEEQAADEEAVDAIEPPSPTQPEAEPSVSEQAAEEAQTEAGEGMFDLPDDESTADQEDESPVSIREHEGDSSDRIQSLLSMEDEEEEGELTLNIGGGSLQEESSEAEEEEPDPDDSMEMFLASAKEDLESKKQSEEEEDDDKDILDELLGDDDLPPAGPAPLDLPDPSKKKKKKKGFISKFFGGDD